MGDTGGYWMKEIGFEDRTIGSILEHKAKTIGEKFFVLHEDLKVPYNEMDQNTNRVANSLLGLGVKKGDKVCMIMGNSLDFLYAWFALARIGAVMVPVNTALKGNLLRYIIDNSDGSLIIIDRDLIDRVSFIQKEIRKVKTIIVATGPSDEKTEFGLNFTVKRFGELLGGSPKNPRCDVRFYDPMAILYTSGTTGPSKGAILSHAYFYSISYQVGNHQRYDEDSVIHSCLPLFHANALMFGALGAMLSEGSFALSKRFSLTTFWNEIRSYKATHTSSVGSIFPLLWKQPPKEDDANNPLKAMSAVPWRPEFDDFEKRFDLKLVTGYGSTESGIICQSPFEERIRPASCGKPLRLYDIRIFDDHDIELGPGSPGEIVVRGKEPYTLMDGYYHMPEATVRAFRNLWYHTGDAGYKDEDGYFYFVDRKKDAIRRRGENISSFEVEEVINSHPKVLESAVFAIPSELGEDDVKAVVVLKKGQKMKPEELISFCEDRMAYFAVPRYLEFQETLPKTPTLRVEKYKLREQGVTKDTWDMEKAGYKLKR
jgi:crotonobetaine/carnitine-CoA ligase